MNENKITKRKWFWGWQDEKEEAWLEKMAEEGYHLESMSMATYHFVKGEPKKVAYRMDFFRRSRVDYDEYLEIFRNEGWEFLGNLSGWQYFRKDKVEGELTEIYTDNESKIAKYHRLIATLVAVFPFYFIIFMINLDGNSIWKDILGIIYVLITVLYAFGFINIMRRINYLKKQNN